MVENIVDFLIYNDNMEVDFKNISIKTTVTGFWRHDESQSYR